MGTLTSGLPCSIITTNNLLMRIWFGLILTHNKTPLFHKTTQFTSEIITLFRVSPQLFHRPAQSPAEIAVESIAKAGPNTH